MAEIKDTHCYREANRVADNSANDAHEILSLEDNLNRVADNLANDAHEILSLEDNLKLFENPPKTCVDSVMADLKGGFLPKVIQSGKSKNEEPKEENAEKASDSVKPQETSQN